ncbi:hypothetical protein [Mycobacterium sp. 1164966.3]|uniref:hypothetical protein n=1 Tax=Mycobacterium sp. 1164966.3 TaxID=1856861 RepID=UPI0009EF4F4F
MRATACRMGAWVAASVFLAAATGIPTAGADPSVALPPMTSSGGGPIVGGGDEAAQGRMSLQLTSRNNPDIQEVDGSDAAAFINAAAGLTDLRLAAPFQLLQRALGCQKDNAGFGARAYRRADGQWGGAVLVIAKSATSDVDTLTNCVSSSWPKPTAGAATSMCNSGWTYPTSGENHRPETYYILLAGTASDFCSVPDANYRNYATAWP